MVTKNVNLINKYKNNFSVCVCSFYDKQKKKNLDDLFLVGQRHFKYIIRFIKTNQQKFLLIIFSFDNKIVLRFYKKKKQQTDDIFIAKKKKKNCNRSVKVFLKMMMILLY